MRSHEWFEDPSCCASSRDDCQRGARAAARMQMHIHMRERRRRVPARAEDVHIGIAVGALTPPEHARRRCEWVQKRKSHLLEVRALAESSPNKLTLILQSNQS